MHSLDIVWVMAAAACLTLAALHLLVWAKSHRAWANLVFSVLAVAVAAIAAGELAMMHAQTPEAFGTFLRWTHVPIFVVVVSIVAFLRLYFRTGRRWLGDAAWGVRLLTLALNFVLPPNLNYREITDLRVIEFLGQHVAVAHGVLSPWSRLAQLSSLLLLAFIVGAAVARWRTGDRDGRRQAWTVGGSLGVFVLAAAGHAALVQAGVIQSPYLLSIFFLAPVAAMGYELSFDVVRAAQLTRDLHHSETRLRDSEERIALAAEAAQLGVWVWDVAADRVWSTDKARELLGVTPTDKPTLAWVLNGVHPDDRESLHRAVRQSLNGDARLETECRIVLPDGAIRWVAIRGRVDSEADRTAVRLRAVSTDITRRKQAELESQRSREEITHLSRVASLGELSGSLAHELNQPLTAILSNAQAARRLLARDAPDVTEVRDIIEDIVADDQRAGEVIRRLQSLFKKGEMQREVLDLTDVVRQTLKLLHGDLVNRNVTLHVDVDGLLPVTGDRVQLQQIVLNLVMNASEAMAGLPAAARRLVVRTERPDTGGGRVSVSDAGVGVAPDMMERIFDPFVSTKPHGLGLGLAVCRSIIAAHGGRLWAVNNPSGGTTFLFTLPTSGASPV